MTKIKHGRKPRYNLRNIAKYANEMSLEKRLFLQQNELKHFD